ncbi:hypothetical protein EEZ25_22160 [Micromonospora aurantiaca]|uniref:hypothetical protein n=1 Tax=Micromonospora aurantiaca (nom. illeg.) TaxID=47850 RepID=UPI000F3D699A|nr:hypothetical protein [Micromonospora aurantiaca]RNH99689.1 hypothetical protein EEZ25_22160 [Micromonospora aurantiaca]
MSEHPPQHHNVPVHPLGPPVADPTLIDVVAGEPPVPVTVWRTAADPGDAGRSVGVRLAYRLVAAYTRPGEAIVDLTTDHALTAVCAAGERRHHPGWFTEASSLIIGPVTPPTRRDPAADDGGDPVPDIAAWFGDDLTDAPPANPGTQPGRTSLAEATSLVVASWPLERDDAVNRIRLAWLLTVCARLLRPGGCLVLAVTNPTTTTGPQDFSPVATAAAQAGLGYLQHIVAVGADTDSDRFAYYATDEELLTLTHPRWVAHLRVHADLLVFSPVPGARRHDGGERP